MLVVSCSLAVSHRTAVCVPWEETMVKYTYLTSMLAYVNQNKSDSCRNILWFILFCIVYTRLVGFYFCIFYCLLISIYNIFVNSDDTSGWIFYYNTFYFVCIEFCISD